MRWYVAILFLCGLYNSTMLDVGHGSKRNLVGFVLCTSSLLTLLWSRIREGTFAPQERLFRRLGVFLFGGFICPSCGDGRVKFGGYMPCVSCATCKKFFLFSTNQIRVRDMWRLVWRRWS